LKAEERRKEEVKKEAEKKAKAKLEEDKRKLEAKKEEERKDKERKEKEKERAEKERKEKEAKKQAEQKDSKASAEEAKKLEAVLKDSRKEMKRIAGVEGASGNENATGKAMKSSGPSDTYSGRIRARVKPNITFDPIAVPGNPRAEITVHCAPDGTIILGKTRITQSSGNTSWDSAVLRAIEKTEIIPRDTDGRVHCPFPMGFTPKE
jgi:colicin import membrane protein